MARVFDYGHYWPSNDQWTVSSVEVGDFGRYSFITSSVYMIFTKFVFKKTYFVKMRRLMVHLSTYDHYWPSYDQWTVSSVGFGNFDRFSLITSSIHMILTKFFFEKTYFVNMRRLMVHLSTYDPYWLTYDQWTVSSVGFGDIDRFSLITSSIHMIITKILFEEMRRMMVHFVIYGHYCLSYDQWTVLSVEFCDFDRFFFISSSIYMIIKKFFFHNTHIIIWHKLLALRR
jgi:hypothetical protein